MWHHSEINVMFCVLIVIIRACMWYCSGSDFIIIIEHTDSNDHGSSKFKLLGTLAGSMFIPHSANHECVSLLL